MKINFDKNTTVEIDLPEECDVATFLTISKKIEKMHRATGNIGIVNTTRRSSSRLAKEEELKFVEEYMVAKKERKLDEFAKKHGMERNRVSKKAHYFRNKV